MKPALLLLLAATLAAGPWSGCAGSSRQAAPEATRYTPEATEKFVTLDPITQAEVNCTGLQERLLADGRLDVVANIRNTQSRVVPIQVDCVFRDEHGMDLHDETPFTNLLLGENVTEAVHFTAASPLARQYSVRVRQPR